MAGSRTATSPTTLLATPPGAFARVRLLVGAPAPVLLVPDAAILPDQSQHLVLTVSPDGTVAPKQVDVGDIRGGLRVVRSGLSASDWVVIDGLPNAAPGSKIVYDPTIFIGQSVNEVVKTIFVAILLVVGVVFLFLQTWRVVAIPVSLIGTFAILALLGISLNNLSLFGLVLAVGIVVDDAIVVVENVERNIRSGMSPQEAAHRTMDEVGGALISIALTLCAVFVPSAFLSGISGLFFRQFAVTIAASFKRPGKSVDFGGRNRRSRWQGACHPGRQRQRHRSA